MSNYNFTLYIQTKGYAEFKDMDYIDKKANTMLYLTFVLARNIFRIRLTIITKFYYSLEVIAKNTEDNWTTISNTENTRFCTILLYVLK